jgi:hypothetical protein
MITDPSEAVEAVIARLKLVPVKPDPRYAGHAFPACTCATDIRGLLIAEGNATRDGLKAEADRHADDCKWAEAVLWLIETWDVKDKSLGGGR